MKTILFSLFVIALVIYITRKNKNGTVSYDSNNDEIDWDTRGEKLEKIVNNYGAALAAPHVKGVMRPMSLLKNSKPEIQSAIKEYIILGIESGNLTKEMYDYLISSYMHMDKFVDDEEAKFINSELERIKIDKTGAAEFFQKYMPKINSLTPVPEDFPKFTR